MAGNIFLRLLLALGCGLLTTSGWMLIKYYQGFDVMSDLYQQPILYIYILSSNFSLVAILSLAFLYHIRQVDYSSIFDLQTKLYNRRYLFNRLHEEWSLAKRTDGNLCVLCFDLDGFKLLNKTYGDNAGDMIINKVAEVARESMRKEDILARISGVEFALILPRCTVEQAKSVAQRMRLGIKNILIPIGAHASIRVTATFGIAIFAEQLGYHDLMGQAQEAMYRGKKQGRDCVVVFAEEP